jgi:hypothetical protein
MGAATSIPLLHAGTLARFTPGAPAPELPSLFEAYDLVLVDCSTHERSLITEILALTDEVVVPLDSESLTFHDGVERIAALFAGRLPMNPDLQFGGVFLARYAPRFRRAREMLTALLHALGPVNCFSAYLPESDAVRQAEARRMSVVTDAPTSQAAHSFYRLAEELTGACVPRVQTPTLMVMPGRALVEEEERTTLPAFEPDLRFPVEPPTSWRERALVAAADDGFAQAVRYAALALLEQPEDGDALELFETCVFRCAAAARYADANALVELSRFLADHEMDRYAAQLLRRATDVDPAHLGAWTDLARLSHLQEERAFALEQCLGLDRGMAAAEAPPSPRRGAPQVSAPSFASIMG